MATSRKRTRRWFLKAAGLGIGTIAGATALHIITTKIRKRSEFDFRRDNGHAILSIETINKILQETPIAGKGELIARLSKGYNVDSAFALGFFRQESEFGSKGLGAKNKNPGNLKIIITERQKDRRLHKRLVFAKYNSFEEGIEAWFARISNGEHYYRAGKFTLEEIAPVYAPPSENATREYIEAVKKSVREYRKIEEEKTKK